MSTKKRLALLPEVLPKPQVVAPGYSSVRSRTLARLSALAALGAAGVAASCTTGTSSTNGDGGPFGLPEGGRESGPDAYGVVDPLPPPSCFRNGAPTVSAKYVEDAGLGDGGLGPRDVQILLTFPQAGVVIGDVTASNATLNDTSSSTNGGSILLIVEQSVSTSSVEVQTSCSAGPSTIRFTLTFSPNSVTVTGLSY